MKLKSPTSSLKMASTRIGASLQPSFGKGRGGRPWRRLRLEVLERDKYLCQCEDCKAKKLVTLADEVDHIVPLCQGGTDDPSNLRAINRECHKLKTQAESRAGIADPRGGVRKV